MAHLWANESQDEARNSRDTFYFRGPVIFSYRDSYPLAALTPWRDARGRRLVIDRADSYGPTTGGHQSDMRGALRGHPVHLVRFAPGDSETVNGCTWGMGMFMEACARGQRGAFVELVANLAAQAHKAAKTGDDRHTDDGAAYHYRNAGELYAHACDLAACAPDAVTRKACAAVLKNNAPDVPAGFLEWGAHEYAAPEYRGRAGGGYDADAWERYGREQEAHNARFTGDRDALTAAALEHAKAKRRAVREAAKARELEAAAKHAKDREAMARAKAAAVRGLVPTLDGTSVVLDCAENIRDNAQRAADYWRDAERIAKRQKRADLVKTYRANAKRADNLADAWRDRAALAALMRNADASRRNARAMRGYMAKDKDTRRRGWRAMFNPKQARASLGYSLALDRFATEAQEAATRVPRLLAILDAPTLEDRAQAITTAHTCAQAGYPRAQTDSLAAALSRVMTAAQGRGMFARTCRDALPRVRAAFADVADIGSRLDAKRRKRFVVGRFRNSVNGARAYLDNNGGQVTVANASHLARMFAELSGRADDVRREFRDVLPFDASRGNLDPSQPFYHFGLTRELLAAWRDAESLHSVASALAQYANRVSLSTLRDDHLPGLVSLTRRGMALDAGRHADRMATNIRDMRANLEAASATIARYLAGEVSVLSDRAREAWERAQVETADNLAALEAFAQESAQAIGDAREAAALASANLVKHWRDTGEPEALRRLQAAGLGVRFRYDAARRVIVSSLGAEVSEHAGRRLWALIRRTIETGQRVAYEWGQGPSVGPFRLVSIETDGATVVGCHSISAREARDFAEVMQWPPFGAPTDADTCDDETATA